MSFVNTDPVTYARLVELLAEFYEPGQTQRWLRTPHPLLGGDTPVSRIRSGRAEDVAALLDQMRSGAVV